MDYLDDRIDDLKRKVKSAKTRSCAMSWARKLVAAKHERGDYFIQGPWTDEVLEALAKAEVEAWQTGN